MKITVVLNEKLKKGCCKFNTKKYYIGKPKTIKEKDKIFICDNLKITKI